jgi:hypothetical protein
MCIYVQAEIPKVLDGMGGGEGDLGIRKEEETEEEEEEQEELTESQILEPIAEVWWVRLCVLVCVSFWHQCAYNSTQH